MEKEKKDSQLPDEIVKLQKHRIMLWCAIIIIGLLAIAQFALEHCDNKILADQFTFASTISSIILSVIAIIMSVVSSDSINSLLHKFRDVHDEIEDVPGKIDSSIQKMDDASGKFHGIYENLKEAPQRIKESTEAMTKVSSHMDASVDILLNLMKEIQNKTENWHLLREDLKEIKEGFQNMAFTPDLKMDTGDYSLTEKQAREIYESGSIFGALLLYVAKLAKDKSKYLSLDDFSSNVSTDRYQGYFYGYLIALRSTGILIANEIKEENEEEKTKFEILSYNSGLDSLKNYLTEIAESNEKLKELIPQIEMFIDKADTISSTE